jgi:hypothetical protein
MRGTLGRFLGAAVLLLALEGSAPAQLPPCYAGFEITLACITERGLDPKVTEYRRKIAEAMVRLGASYKIDLRPVNHPVEAGYNAATAMCLSKCSETMRCGTSRSSST